MNSVVLLAHAPLASALKECVRHVFADEIDAVMAVDVAPTDQPEQVIARLCQWLNDTTQHQNVLILTDIFGATPCNIAQKACAQSGARLVAGVNVPMLMRAMTYRHEPLDIMAERVIAGGLQGVMNVANTALQNQKRYASHDPNAHHHQQ